MKITDVHGESWVVRRRWQPWNRRPLGWRLLREYWTPEFFILLGVIEEVAAAVAVPVVLILRLAGVMTTTVEVREHGQRSPKQQRRENRAVWIVPVHGLWRARRVRDGLAAFVREHGNDGQLHRRLADDPQARGFDRAVQTV